MIENIEEVRYEFDIAPLTVVTDPKRMRRLLMQEEESLFPTEINDLFHKQLEEADDSDMLEMIKCFMNGTKNDIIEQNGEIAHFKTYSISSGGSMKLSLTANDEIGVAQDNAYIARSNSFVINARVRLEPELLEKIVRERLHESCEKFGMTYTDLQGGQL